MSAAIDPATVKAKVTIIAERSEKANKAYDKAFRGEDPKKNYKKAAKHWKANEKDLLVILKALGPIFEALAGE
jgi:hypothetical protein